MVHLETWLRRLSLDKCLHLSHLNTLMARTTLSDIVMRIGALWYLCTWETFLRQVYRLDMANSALYGEKL
jgi:hypothetical protein